LTKTLAVQLQNKTMNAETAGPVGIQKLKRLVMESIKKFLREYTDQAISFGTASTDDAGVRPGPGQQPQASSSKLQAASALKL